MCGQVIPGRGMVFITCAFGISFVDGNSSEEVLCGSPVFMTLLKYLVSSMI